MQIPFVGPTYDLESRAASVQRTINMVPVPQEPGNERTPWVFKDVPGLTVVSEQPTDPLFDDVLLLVHMDTDFTDYSKYAVIPVFTGAPSISTLDSKFGTGAGTAGAVAERRVTYNGSHLNLAVLSEYTIELWRNRIAPQGAVYLLGEIGNGNTYSWYMGEPFAFAPNITNQFVATNAAGAGAVLIAQSVTPAYNDGVWAHIAVTKQGSVYRLFVNGVLETSTTYSGSLYTDPSGSGVRLFGQRIGAPTLGSNDYQNEVRITARCRYTANFTPPTAPFPNAA